MKTTTHVLVRKEPHSPISRMVFMIAYNDRGEPANGSVYQECINQTDGFQWKTDFVWNIDGVEYEFQGNGLYPIPLLRRLWIEMKNNTSRSPSMYVEEESLENVR